MNISKEELENEKKYLDDTKKIIKELLESKDENIKQRADSITEMKRYIWENTGTLDDVEVATSMYDINENVSSTNEEIKTLYNLKKSLKNPYFGRIDFKKDGKVINIYIGLNGINKDFSFYVFDWRTPVASLFYNYEKGPASYDAPAGKIKGDITLKRQYKISDGILERCFNSDINIDDDYLQEILSTASSEKMTNIVNTIQKEQNEIIRNVTDKYLIVQGIAGSGKTSVALHRIAYLLYKEKDLNSNNILIFSPNDVFSEYISQVLPELGEENVLETTFSDFASSYLKNKLETFTNFIERYYNNSKNDDSNYELTKYKQSDEFKKILDEKIDSLQNDISFTKGFKLNNIVITKNQLNEMIKEKYKTIPLFERLEFMSENLCDLINISYNKYGKTIYNSIKERLNISININEVYNDIIKDVKEKLAIKDAGKDKKIYYEDIIPLMYLNFELNGYPSNRGIKHIIIDEAQDYTLLQLTMLKKIFKTATFTILGDVNQTINPYYKYEKLDKINEIFDNKGKYIELSKTYRSSEDIIDYTNKIININNVCSVRRSNNIPVNVKDVTKSEIKEELINDINNLRDNKIKRIAIITKNYEQALELYKKLKEDLENLLLIDNKEKSKMGDLVILPSYISKGLEFDGVIAYSSNNTDYDEKDKYLYYVVCTRAQHSLSIYNEPSLILKNE